MLLRHVWAGVTAQSMGARHTHSVIQANSSANIDRLFPFRSKRLTHPAHMAHTSKSAMR